MNYRHAFHAGNFADVHKHIVLTRILLHLKLKPAPFRIIDTHAGAGRYDLLGPEASRSGEWHSGIERIWRARLPADLEPFLKPYVEAVAAFNTDDKLAIYPGSPLIAAHLSRPQDRLIACEVEPRSLALLVAALRGDRRAKALAVDGWTALGAYVPPKERRGLVLIDPPFEDAADFGRLASVTAAAHRKWPTGIYCLWYPIKRREEPDALARRVQRLAVPNVLCSELTLGPPQGDAGLIGSGLLVINPPFTLERELQGYLPMVCKLLSPEARSRTGRLSRGQPAGG